MKITLLVMGKTSDQYLLDGIEKYVQRLKHYIHFKLVELPELRGRKNYSQEEQQALEAKLIIKNINASDYVIALDEHAEQLSSIQFSELLNKKMVAGISHVVFLIGGPYGFHSSVYTRANDRISLSKMTFSHQMIRLFFIEQLYRAYTILKREAYHHA